MAFAAVLDACVLIPAALRDTLLRAAAAGLFRLHWSAELLDEVQRNLARNGMTSLDGAACLRQTMEEHFEEASIPLQQYQLLIPAMGNDEKDRHVLAVAVASGSQVIVTSNLKDFPAHALELHQIEAQSPDEFLLNLLDLAPEQMLAIVKEQAAALQRPSIPLGTVLEHIRQHAPGFAQAIQQADLFTPGAGTAAALSSLRSSLNPRRTIPRSMCNILVRQNQLVGAAIDARGWLRAGKQRFRTCQQAVAGSIGDRRDAVPGRIGH